MALSRIQEIAAPTNVNFYEIALAQKEDEERKKIDNATYLRLKNVKIVSSQNTNMCEMSTGTIPRKSRKTIFLSVHTLRYPVIRATVKAVRKSCF